MAISDTDFVKLGKVVRSNINDALEQVVFPKFDEVKKDLAEVKEELRAQGKRIDNVENKLGGLEEKVDELTDEVRNTNKKFEVMIDEFSDHETRISKLEDEAGIESKPLAI